MQILLLLCFLLMMAWHKANPKHGIFLAWAMVFCTAAIQAQNTRIHHQPSTQLKTDAPHTRIVPPNAYQALPSHLDLTPLWQWLAPNENPKNLVFSGMRRWQHDRQFIVAACFANAPVDKKSFPINEDQCDYSAQDKQANHFYLAVIQLSDTGFNPIAKSGLIQIDMPTIDGDISSVDGYGYLDLAPYRIAPNTMAFGLRTSASVGYAGGGLLMQNLVLFRINGQKLDVILNTLIHQHEDIAGQWHADGTREHDISTTNTTVVMRPTQTLGFYDLMLKSDGDKSILKWDGLRYQ